MNLKIFFLSVLLVFFVMMGNNVLAQNALQDAITQTGLKMEDVRAVTTFYYQDPQPDQMVAVLKVLAAVPTFTSDRKHFPIIAHIFSTAAHSDQAVLEKITLLKDGLNGVPKKVVEGILKNAQDFHSPEADSQEHIDFLWSEFFATGKTEPVKKIIGALSAPLRGVETKMLAASSQWSLASNVKQHKRVYEIVKSESANATGALKKTLEQML